MPNQSETASYEGQLDKFAQALATARKMQQDWLTYGLDFVHIYVEDVDGDWLETWEHDEILGNQLLDSIKEFLVSDDILAVQVRQQLGEKSLFDFAVNLAACERIAEEGDRLSAVISLLADDHVHNLDVGNLAAHLVGRFFA
ncbi:hypothetical protein H6G80_29105 [Nostoc sp. FACHB-87]|uniref:hypothetical protein n=1 Tax=Nostocaceae TaxID=1162 RepID=UPI001686E6EA|nr:MULTISPECIES: hypothetical protein [Nostocaceae]MBD2299294.1 hypothetical protein [Nostoc sp. FACHB-190]MBD2458111.1 hypothetical protein [Nostoc sp. FACHB-87]MBD2479309.1 hypothetical protein [Anabaena sp. FACHB-83]